MFDLPKECTVNKFIPKKTFYEKLNIATGIKEEFTNLIEKITWLYKIAPDTLGVNKTENIEEIEIFELVVKQKKIPKTVIKTITKGIPYKILFLIKYNEEFIYAIKVDEVYFTNWNEVINISFSGHNLEIIYENIVKNIIKESDKNENLNIIIERKSKENNLAKQIEQLKTKVKQEKQFNRKVELNNKLHGLEVEMEELLNE